MTDSLLKRLKPAASVAAGATSVIASEPGLLQLIASFIPSDTEAPVGDATQRVILRTIASLCRAIPTASRSLGPENEAFWRRLVLSHFDFTVSADPYNIVNMNIIGRDNVPQAFRDGQERTDPDAWAEWCRDPLKAPLDAWTAAHPDDEWDDFFDEPYRQWEALSVHFRPSQYGFLHTIQADFSRIAMDWPASERAFSLFSDLVLLRMLVRPQWTGFETYAHSQQFVTPVLLRALGNDVTQGHDFAMLELCSFKPPFWTAGEGVSDAWSGYHEPRPSADIRSVTTEEPWEPERDEYATDEEYDLFPMSSARDFVDLRRLVYDVMEDWRRVSVNSDQECGPVFYIGRRKRSGRWIGLFGERDYA